VQRGVKQEAKVRLNQGSQTKRDNMLLCYFISNNVLPTFLESQSMPSLVKTIKEDFKDL
jgi:hypothetical protein